MSTKADTWMPLYLADYLRATMHLTTEQHGAYLLLIMACWERAGSLPNDQAQLAGIARMTPAAWRKIASVILAFFQDEGPTLTQKRVLAEYQKAQQLSATRREQGLKGGRPRKQTESKSKPIGYAKGKLLGKQNETPSPTVERASKKALSHSGAEESAGRSESPPPLRLVPQEDTPEQARARELGEWIEALGKSDAGLIVNRHKPEMLSEIEEFRDVARARIAELQPQEAVA